MTASRPQVIAVGDNCVDVYLPPVNEAFVGGNAVNVAVQWAMLGRSSICLTAVGADQAGRAVLEALAERGVAIDRIRVLSDQRTPRTDIASLRDGDRQFVFEDFGACATYRPDEDDLAILRQARAVHIGWLPFVPELKRALAVRAGLLSQDLSVNNTPENLVPDGLDIAFISAAPAAAEMEARRLLSAGARLAVVTCGAAGSLATDGREWQRAAAPVSVPVDTTGAGDAFIAGFLDARLETASLTDSLQHATRCAARACLHKGGFPQEALDVRILGQM